MPDRLAKKMDATGRLRMYITVCYHTVYAYFATSGCNNLRK